MPHSAPITRWLPAIVLAIALLVRLAAAVWWQSRLPDDHSFAFGDSTSYWVLAQHIVRGEPYRYGIDQSRIFRAPGYPLLLAGLFLVVGSDPPVLYARVLGAVLGTAAVGGIMWLAGALFDQRVGNLAGLLAAIYPGAIGMSVFVLSEAPFCAVMVWQLGCWIQLLRHDRQRLPATRWACATGILAGLATLVRPSWLLFTPFALGVHWLAGSRRRASLIHAGLILLTLCAVMTPWWIRNYRVTGKFVATTLQMGASLYDGMNPQATGASNMEFVATFYAKQLEADRRSPPPPDEPFEVRLDQRMKQASLQWMRENPQRVLQLMAIKLVRMWSPWPHAAEMQSWKFRLLTCLGFVPLLVATIWGSWRFREMGWTLALCWMPALYFTLLHMIFVSSIRYRQPPMLVLTAISGAALYCWLGPRCGWPTCQPRPLPDTQAAEC